MLRVTVCGYPLACMFMHTVVIPTILLAMIITSTTVVLSLSLLLLQLSVCAGRMIHFDPPV